MATGLPLQSALYVISPSGRVTSILFPHDVRATLLSRCGASSNPFVTPKKRLRDPSESDSKSIDILVKFARESDESSASSSSPTASAASDMVPPAAVAYRLGSGPAAGTLTASSFKLISKNVINDSESFASEMRVVEMILLVSLGGALDADRAPGRPKALIASRTVSVEVLIGEGVYTTERGTGSGFAAGGRSTMAVLMTDLIIEGPESQPTLVNTPGGFRKLATEIFTKILEVKKDELLQFNSQIFYRSSDLLSQKTQRTVSV